MKPGDITGKALTSGHLLEFDRYFDEVNNFRSTLRDLPVNIKEPDEDILDDVQREYIINYVNKIETMLYGSKEVDKAYWELLNMDSFIDWWIVMELTGEETVERLKSNYLKRLQWMNEQLNQWEQRD